MPNFEGVTVMIESELVFKAMRKRKISGCMDYKITDEIKHWKVLLLTENFKWVAVKIPKER